MKHRLLFVLFVLGVTFSVSAQGWNGGRKVFGQKPENVTVTGVLALTQGHIALKEGDTTYFVGGLGRLVGFVDGLKEGARVTLEGAAISSPNDAKLKMLRVSKLSINGKEYELDQQGGGARQRRRDIIRNNY
ncbi:MAG: hypothetical protein LBC77_08240 [Spirochaetaceae bacterium]|jgi:hypothetical protein|nr:hypothetical protein [Spirochaetaceae bacterium]